MKTMVTAIDEDKLLYNMTDGTYLYEGQPFTGVARERSKDGGLISEIEYADGMQNGLARYWYQSGQLQGEEHFRNNGRTGLSREWYPDGKLKRETDFEYSIRLREKQWDEQGNIVKDYVLTEQDPMFGTLEKARRAHGNSRREDA